MAGRARRSLRGWCFGIRSRRKTLRPAATAFAPSWRSFGTARTRQLAGMKHLNRLEQVLARSEVPAEEAAELLVFSSSGNLVSGTMSNVFLVRQGRVVHAETGSVRCRGRHAAGDPARGALRGLAVEESVLSAADLASADGDFHFQRARRHLADSHARWPRARRRARHAHACRRVSQPCWKVLPMRKLTGLVLRIDRSRGGRRVCGVRMGQQGVRRGRADARDGAHGSACGRQRSRCRPACSASAASSAIRAP